MSTCGHMARLRPLCLPAFAIIRNWETAKQYSAIVIMYSNQAGTPINDAMLWVKIKQANNRQCVMKNWEHKIQCYTAKCHVKYTSNTSRWQLNVKWAPFWIQFFFASEWFIKLIRHFMRIQILRKTEQFSYQHITKLLFHYHFKDSI